MKHLTTLVILMILVSPKSFAQLPSGSMAPDFTLTDIDGNTHHLYDYLAEGKIVYIDFWAAHCPSCWAYHNQGHFENLHLMHGQNGTTSQDVIVFGIEVDYNNGLNEYLGISGNTQGNWLEGLSYPVFNPEGAELTAIINAWEVNYYPLIYSICPDGTLTLHSQQSTSILYSTAGECATIGQEEIDATSALNWTLSNDNQIQFTGIENAILFELVDLSGRIIFSEMVKENNTSISLTDLPGGVYVGRLSENGVDLMTKRVFIP